MTFGVDTPELEFRYEACEGKYTPPFSVLERTVSTLPVLTVLVHHPTPVSLTQAQTKGLPPILPKSSENAVLAASTCISDLHRVFISTTANTVHINIISGDLQASILFFQALVPLPPTLHPGARDDPLHADWFRSLP